MKLTKEMKLRKEPHIVPLATQAMDLLSKVQHFTGRGRYIFRNPRNKDLPMSENAVNVALKRMGFGDVRRPTASAPWRRRCSTNRIPA